MSEIIEVPRLHLDEIARTVFRSLSYHEAEDLQTTFRNGGSSVKHSKLTLELQRAYDRLYLYLGEEDGTDSTT